MDINNKKTAFAILEYLSSVVYGNNKCSSANALNESQKESLVIAAQCISSAFKVRLDNDADRKSFSLFPSTLDSLISESDKKQLTPETITQAEAHKSAGNEFVKSCKYDEAVIEYSKAIALVKTNAIYYFNRACAYTQLNKLNEAIQDSNEAVRLDPGYAKAHARLGLLYYKQLKYKESVAAYKRAIAIDPSCEAFKTACKESEAKLSTSEAKPSSSSSLNGSSSNGGSTQSSPLGGGFDLASLMNNPALMNMASQMLSSNGGPNAFSNLMKNPEIAKMAQAFMGGNQSKKDENDGEDNNENNSYYS